MQPTRLLENRVVFLAPRLVDPVVAIVANHRLVRWNDRDLELVDLEELVLLRLGSARHPGELLVHPEVVLNRDGRHGLRLTLHVNAFLGFHRLMQPFRPPPARHCASRELVDDEHFAFLDDVVHITVVERVRAQQLVHDV